MAEYTGGASRGWVPERFLKQRRFLPVLTAGAEASQAIPVTIQCRTYEASGNEYVNAEEAITLVASLYDDNGLEAVVGSFTMAESGAGTIISTTAKPRIFLTTDANGAATITVTDVSGVFAGSVHLVVEVLNKPGFAGYVELTFA